MLNISNRIYQGNRLAIDRLVGKQVGNKLGHNFKNYRILEMTFNEININAHDLTLYHIRMYIYTYR